MDGGLYGEGGHPPPLLTCETPSVVHEDPSLSHSVGTALQTLHSVSTQDVEMNLISNNVSLTSKRALEDPEEGVEKKKTSNESTGNASYSFSEHSEDMSPVLVPQVCPDAIITHSNIHDAELYPNSQLRIQDKTQHSPLVQLNSDSSVQRLRPPVVNKYKPSDRGPFWVYVEGKDSTIGRLHPMTLGKILHSSVPGSKENIVNIQPLGRNKIKIEMKNAISANNLVSASVFSDRKLEAYIPSHCVHRQGLIRSVETGLGEEEIQAVAVSEYRILHVRRFTKQIVREGVKSLIRLQTCVLTFDSQHLPPYIYIHGSRCEVVPYVPTLRICYNCYRHGHTRTQCRSQGRCNRCGGPHLLQDCDSIDMNCLHCHGQHLASDKSCPEYQRRKRITEFAAENNISFNDARIFLERNSYSARIGNTQTVPLGVYCPLPTNNITPPDIRREDIFPSLPVTTSLPTVPPSIPPPFHHQSQNLSFPRHETTRSAPRAKQAPSNPSRPPGQHMNFNDLSNFHYPQQRPQIPLPMNPYPPAPHALQQQLQPTSLEMLIDHIYNFITTLLQQYITKPSDSLQPTVVKNMLHQIFQSTNGV